MTIQTVDAPTGLPLASLGQRFGAILLDQIIAWVLLILSYATMGAALFASAATYEPVTGSSGSGSGLAVVLFYVGVFSSIAFGIYQWYGVAVKGQTVGKRATGISIVDQESGRPIGWGRAFIRYLIFVLLGIPCWLGQVALLFVIPGDLRRQGWHDKVAKTVVIQGKLTGLAEGSTITRVATRPECTDSKPVSPPRYAGLASGSSTPPPHAGLASGSSVAPRPSHPTDPSSTPRPATTPVTTPGVPGPVLPPPPSRVGAVPPPPQPVTPPPGDSAVDDHTRIGARPVAPAGGWRLVGPTIIPLSGTVVVGREPDGSAVPGATRLVIDDPARSMSKTHAALVAGGPKLTVEDLDSTNGVYIARAGVETRVPSRTPIELKAGESVLFGDVSFTVEQTA